MVFALAALFAGSRRDEIEIPQSDKTRRMAGVRFFKLGGTVDLYASALHNFDDETNLGGAFSWDAGATRTVR